MNPIVSVCIPAFRHPHLVTRAVNSVFSQSFADFEVIVTDDSDSDEVWHALEPWHQDSRLIYFRNPSRLGSPGNWNRAMSLARTELIKFLHHDDWLTETTALGQFVDVMQSDEKIDFAFSSANACEDDGSLIFVHKLDNTQLKTIRNDPLSLQFGNLIGAPSATIFRKQEGFQFDENLRWVVDIDAYIALLGDNPKFHYFSEALVNISSNGAHQVTRTISRDKISRIAEHLYLYSKHRPTKCGGHIKGWVFLLRLFSECNFKELQDIRKLRENQERSLQETIILSGQLLRSFFIEKILALKKSARNTFTRHDHSGHQSYAQCGEDMIVDFLLMWLGNKKVTYLDIGAHHPTWLSNTYHFYKLGHRGVLIEPDELLCKGLRSVRPHDKVLNIAVGTGGNDIINMYVMTSKTLNTLDKEQAETLQATGREKIEAVMEVRRLGINEVLAEHFPDTPPVFVSLDIEGLDYAILQAWNFSRFRPIVFCVETLTYTQNNTERKLTEILDLMRSNRYRIYADTFVNTIFVCEDAWRERPVYA
jgi:FkbM family methyltransferase